MRRAFTAIELVIAIALGLVLCLTAAATMRTSLAAVGTANRLSLENGMLREGIATALDDLDWWTTFDDPDDPAKRRLRAPGEAFSPLPDPVDCDFDVSAPKNWWRGLGCSLVREDYGDYAIVARIDHPDADRSRLARFHRAVVDGLGFLALCDHAPADTVYAYYGADHRVPAEFVVSAPGNIGGYDAGQMPGDFIMLLDDHAFALTLEPWYLANGVGRRRFNVWSDASLGWTGVGNWEQSGLYLCVDPVPTLALQPAHWPSLDVTVRRTASAYRQWHIATVTVASPITGDRQRLCFSTTSTTLRGARKQRDRVDGWAVAGRRTLDIAE